MTIRRAIGVLAFAATCSVLIATAGGGAAFVRHPVGVTYLALWSGWWLVIAMGRQRGARSTYDKSQWVVIALGTLALIGLIILPPWEYAHFTGPLPRDGLWAWVGLGLFAAGIALQVAAFRALRGFYTSRLGIQPGHHLVTGGPYRLVRHPGYLSNLMCLTGMGLALSSIAGLALVAFVLPLIVWRIACEEQMLVTELGAAYQAYKQRTRWHLIPLIY